jgi:hypothetical protein
MGGAYRWKECRPAPHSISRQLGAENEKIQQTNKQTNEMPTIHMVVAIHTTLFLPLYGISSSKQQGTERKKQQQEGVNTAHANPNATQAPTIPTRSQLRRMEQIRKHLQMHVPPPKDNKTLGSRTVPPRLSQPALQRAVPPPDRIYATTCTITSPISLIVIVYGSNTLRG